MPQTKKTPKKRATKKDVPLQPDEIQVDRGPRTEEEPEEQADRPQMDSATQQGWEDAREAERQEQRRQHNERTGGGTIGDGERQAQREEHNERVGDASLASIGSDSEPGVPGAPGEPDGSETGQPD